MNFLIGFKSTVDRLLKGFLVVSTLSIFSIVLMLVVMRYLFNTTLVGANETITILFVYTMVIGAAMAVGQREHIAVTVVVDKLPALYRQILDVLVLLAIALLNGAMVWYSLVSWIPVTGRFLMPALQLPQIYAQIAVPVGGSLAILYCLLLILLGEGSADDAGAGE